MATPISGKLEDDLEQFTNAIEIHNARISAAKPDFLIKFLHKMS
jgi:hypothetical protein